MKKQVLGLFLCLAMVLTFAPKTAFAAGSGTWGDNLTWELDGDGTLTISGTGAMNDFTMDPYGDNAAWKQFRPEIKKVVIENGVTSIGNRAFAMLNKLESVTMPESVTSIGDMSFESCGNLVEINFSNSITSIGVDAFWGCDILTDITLPDGLLSLGRNCFEDTNLESITIPAGVTSINTLAFRNCNNLKSVTFAGAAPGFGDLPFDGVTATVYYLECSGTWTEGVKESCGGTLTWVANEHNEVIDTPEVPATCSKDGHEKASHCSSCNMQISNGDVIPATGNHTEEIDVEAKAATCGTDGHEKVSHCSVCDKLLFRGKTIPATGKHTEEIDMEAKAATCGTDGHEKVSHCRVCDKSLSRGKTIPATGEHTSVTDEEKAATYSKTGLTEGSHCSVCGEVLIAQTETPMLTLAKPVISSLTNGSTAVTVKWKKVTGATGYKVYRKAGSATSWSLAKTITSGSTVSWNDTKRTNGTKYQYKIVATAGTNKSADSAVKTVYRLSRPSLTSGTKNIATKKIVVKWKKNSTCTGYQVKYVTGGTKKTVKVSGKSTLSKTLKSLKEGKTYKVYVRCYKKVGGKTYYSAYSSAKRVKVSK